MSLWCAQAVGLCALQRRKVHPSCFDDSLGRDQCSTEMEESGVTMHVGDSGKNVKTKLLKNGLNIPKVMNRVLE